MPNCPKCGAKVTEAMNFCANCGAPLKAAPPPVAAPALAPAPAPSRPEKYEKHEKGEKGEKQQPEKAEKTEKHEKQQYGPFGPIILGVVLIVIGVFFYLMTALNVSEGLRGAYFLVIIGIAIILAVIIGAATAARRHPST